MDDSRYENTDETVDQRGKTGVLRTALVLLAALAMPMLGAHAASDASSAGVAEAMRFASPALVPPTPGLALPNLEGRINNLKVLSSAIDDVTTAESIIASFVKPGMTDAERAKALWTAAVRYRHQSAPPDEGLAADWEAHDPVKLFNVYGYCMCCCGASLIEALNRLDGREARGRILNGHSVPEVKYGGTWHMYDCSLITFFPNPGGSEVASVDEISSAVRGWLDGHPGYRGNKDKLADLMQSADWTGWKTGGPALLGGCPFLKRGFFPALTHGWNDTMQEYDRESEIYEYGYHLGTRALFSLRPGESFVREAGNRGLHVMMETDPKWNGLKAKAPEGDLAYLKDFLPAYRGGIVGNGVHRYAPDLASGGLAAGAEVYDNLTIAAGSPVLRVRDPARAGTAVIEMSSPYVYLGGRLALKAIRRGNAGRVVVSISTNNGRTFSPLWRTTWAGDQEALVDLKKHIFRRYAYWLKIEIKAGSPAGAGVDAISIENDFQHAPRALPWLAKGNNTITIAAGDDVALATRTIACRITNDARFARNETTSSMGVIFDNLDVQDGSCWWKGGKGAMTVPVETPGDLAVLRFGGHFRARGEKDEIRISVSFDGGTAWIPAASVRGPTPGTTDYFRFERIPPGTRRALLRYEFTGDDTVGVLSFRVDADYRDPKATGRFRPFRVVHSWRENGEGKSAGQVVTELPATYTIHADSDPEMISVSCEMPAR